MPLQRCLCQTDTTTCLYPQYKSGYKYLRGTQRKKGISIWHRDEEHKTVPTEFVIANCCISANTLLVAFSAG